MRSLARRVAWGMIGGTACFVGLAALLIWVAYLPLVWHRIDADLDHDARRIAPFAARQVHSHRDDDEPVDFGWRRGDPGLMYAMVRLADGAVVGRRELGEPPAWAALAGGDARMTMIDQRPWRIARLPLSLSGMRRDHPPPWSRGRGDRERGGERGEGGERSGDADGPRDRGPRWPPEPGQGWGLFDDQADHLLVLLRDVDHLAAEQLRVQWGLLALVFGATAIAGLGAWLVTRGVLRPLRRMADAIGQLDGSGHRLLPGPMPSELQVVPERLNQLLDRIDQARERERQFHAAAAHELRTPLAGLQAQLEVALMREREAAAYRETLATCLQVSGQLQRLVEDLLHLARVDAGGLQVERAAVDLRDLFMAAFQAQGIEAERLERAWPEDLPPVDGDRRLLERVADNLVGNLVHGDAAGGIRLEARAEAGRLRVRLENACRERPAEDLERLLDPFVRAAVERGAGHTGLGLALVRALVELQAGTVHIDWSQGRFAVIVDLPLFTALSS